MNDKKLLASVALFGQLFNSSKYTNISGIIAEFIKGAIVLNNKYCLTSYELKNLIKDTYDFDLLESVIKTVVYSNLKDIVEVKDKVFNFNDSIKEKYKTVESELENINQINDSIYKGLKQYITEKEKKQLSTGEEEEILENFSQFLFENGTSDKYSNHISSYIVKNETDTNFVNNLNEIREGLILYQGIRYTANINELGAWKNKMVIYLNTEYLFNALEYNGILYKEIFDDFYNLVCEINANDKETISLKYFPDTVDEIDSFFLSAESILKREKKLLPWKTAMKKIIDSCKAPSDIVALKVDFYLKLEKLGIELQEFDYEVNEYAAFNVVDEKTIEKLKGIAKEKDMRFNEASCHYFFKIFTKVNFFRKGNNKKPFNNIGHIFISDSGFAKYLGHNNSVKFESADTTFAKDLDFVTTQFWIELKKGFSSKSKFPKSFNVLTKAKIIISSHINNSMSKEFDQLIIDTDKGVITKEVALARSYALRTKPNLPSEVTHENIDETFNFLNNENYLADIYQEQIKKDELVKQTQQQNIALQQEIERRDKIESDKKQKLKEEEFDNNKKTFINTEWEKVKSSQNRDLLFSSIVFLLNLALAISAVILTSTTKLKNWISEFDFWQISLIVIYSLIIVFEIFGSKYIFNKEKLKNGWFWFTLIFDNYKKFEFKETTKKHLDEVYNENHSDPRKPSS